MTPAEALSSLRPTHRRRRVSRCVFLRQASWVGWLAAGVVGGQGVRILASAAGPGARGRSGARSGPLPRRDLIEGGALGFFNSDESGTLQAYMIGGLETLAGSSD